MSAILSFLGGSIFRMIFGEISAFMTKRQDHKHEVELMRLQGDLESARFERQQAAITKQHELGIQTIHVQGEQDVLRAEASAWAAAVSNATAPTGITWVDAWNGIIRPLAASISIFLWVVALNAQGWKMSDWDKELVGVVLGFFFASRMMQRSGK